MDWQLAIDIKWWKEYPSPLLYELLSFAKGKKWLSIKFSDKLYMQMPPSSLSLTSSMLQQILCSPYDSKPDNVAISLQPDLRCGLNQQEIVETENVAYSFLEQSEPPHKIYALLASRNADSQDELIIQGNSTKSVALLTIDETIDSLKHFLKTHEPVLNQAKHNAHQTRYLGGEVVSKFSAWNPRDPERAQKLLKEAFDNSGAKLLPPDEMFVWDSLNETYVRFMHSGNWEYHGHDFDEFNRIPEKVKARYNHRKK